MKAPSARVFSGIGLLSLVLLAAPSQPVFGAAIANLAALGANDGVDWNTISNVGNPSFTVSSAGGIGVTVSEPSSQFVKTSQGPWFGNFPAGTVIVYDQGPNGPVTFTFATPVLGFGLTVDDAVGGNYTGTINEFNGSTLMGSYITGPAPYGLMFLGVRDATADITSITISTTNGFTANSFAFGNLSLVNPAPAGNVPEPASIGSFALGLGAMAMGVRGRSRRLRQGGLETEAAL
jgi:hypothetical protein